MPFLRFIAILVVLMIIAGESALGEDVTLVEQGKPCYTIIIPDKNDDYARSAANFLSSMVHRTSGARMLISNERSAPVGPKIYVGRTQAAEWSGVDFARSGLWCVLKAFEGNLILAGHDGSKHIQRDPGYVWLGTRKAVQMFLQDYVGVRWLIPDQKGDALIGTSTLLRDTITFPAGLDRLWRSPFEWMHVAAFEDAEFFDMNTKRRASIAYKTYGGHSYYTAVPAKRYARTHPEYFALIAGERNSSRNHLCVSNRDVQNLLYKEMIASVDAGYVWVQLAQTDGYQPCECDACRAISPNAGERLWIVHNALAKRLERDRPAAKVVLLAYGPTRELPETIDHLNGNVIVEIASPSRKRLQRWREKAPALLAYLYIWGEYHPMAFAPKTTPRMVAELVKYLRDGGVRGIYCCGSGESWGLEGPVYYIFHRCLDNPDCDWQAELDEYYRAAFGRAYQPMKKFYGTLYLRLDTLGTFYDDWPRYWSTPSVKLSELPREPETMYTTFFPPMLLKRMQVLLDRASKLEPTGAVHKRIEFVGRAFVYVRDIAEMFHLYRAYQVKPSVKTLELVTRAVRQRNSRINALFAQGGGEARYDGLPRMFAHFRKDFVLAGGRLYGILGSPASWDTDALLEARGMLPGVGMPRMTAQRVTGDILLDGKLGERTWAKAEAVELREISLGKVAERTVVRVAYDERFLYLAFECSETLAEQLSGWWKPHGHDGPVYSQDCVEVFVDPVGDLQQYFHFICGGVQNSYYEEAFGLKRDVYHPLYNKMDAMWNGAWDYFSTIDVPRQRWIVEMALPFGTLNTHSPKPGEIWRLNLARERFIQNKNPRAQPELYCWSPNLEKRTFVAPTFFGKLIFK